MSTSSRTMLIESAAPAVLVAGAVALAAPHDPGLTGIGFHPVWLPIVVAAARHGSRGLLVGLAGSAVVLVVVALALGGSPSGLVARATDGPDIFFLMTAIAVSWVAHARHDRADHLADRLAEVERSLADSDALLD